MDVPLNVVLSLFVAILINRPLRGMNVFRTIFFLPNVTSITVLAIIFFRFLAPRPDGPINYLIGLIGLPPQNWLLDEKLALPSVVGMAIWASFGYYMILWLAGLKSISSELYDASKVDGAAGWKMHWYMTLPLLRPTAAFILMISTIGALQVFGSIYLLTGGGPLRSTTTVAFHIYQRAFTFAELGYACSVSILLFVIIMAVSILQGKYLKFGESIY
jgi:ABC-type sugar transport system permease subunit